MDFLVTQTSKVNAIYLGPPKPPRPRGEEALSLHFPTQEPRQQHIALQRALPKPGEGLRCRQARCPIGQRGPREQRRRPTPHGTHIPSDAPARPTPAPRRRRTQLHTKDPVWRSRPPERRCQAAGNHGGKRTETDGAGGEGRGWPARDGTGRDATEHSSPPPRPGARRPPAPASPAPACALLSQASSGIDYPAVLTLQPVYYAGRACKSLRAFITLWGVPAERHFLGRRGGRWMVFIGLGRR